ncbi:CLUMA_CG016614, isoform A [Clunio marinus]|uniref:CLUMA_CG016614, isoform A n=1 Tax=Clunio marinus TaxID=568069 RepID=A0A1J1IU48_9DIPT|nr:CLUMA_CG016614, isoform A [Clunio marinus]
MFRIPKATGMKIIPAYHVVFLLLQISARVNKSVRLEYHHSYAFVGSPVKVPQLWNSLNLLTVL